MADKQPQLDETQKLIFDKIAKNDDYGFEQLLAQLKGGVNFVDENGMSPLQHASCKGNKDAVRALLDMGADINHNQHGANYTPLHFAALSGNASVCRILLDAGINASSVNSVSRTAAQMAAFVGNHGCVETINNYVARSSLAYYTMLQGLEKEPLLPPASLVEFHNFVVNTNLHPVGIVLSLQDLGMLRHLSGLRKALELMCEKEMKKAHDINELMAFKFHYLSWMVAEVQRCEEQAKAKKSGVAAEAAGAGKHDYVELFIKRVLKENKLGQLDYVEFTVRECVREFPFRECTVFRQVIAQLAAQDAPPALCVLRTAINGHRGFTSETTICSTCGTEKPDKKCSKCKAVSYCNRECQRLHWFMHKKTCARPTSNNPSTPTVPAARGPIDTSELSEEIARLSSDL